MLGMYTRRLLSRRLTRVCACAVLLIICYWNFSSEIPFRSMQVHMGTSSMYAARGINLAEVEAAWIADRKFATAHYVWCGERVFRFENFLSLMSLVKVFESIKVVLHYEKEPKQTEYHSWFDIAQNRTPTLEMTKLPKGSCNGTNIAGPKVIATILAKAGGVWVGDTTLVTRAVLKTNMEGLHHSGPWSGVKAGVKAGVKVGQGVVMVRQYIPLRDKKKEDAQVKHLEQLLQSPPSLRCIPVSKPGLGQELKNRSHDVGREGGDSVHCLAFDSAFVSRADRDHVLHPKDIWTLDSELGRAARLVVYGSQQVQVPPQNFSQLSPLISHQIWLGDPNFRFDHFLAVQSALHVAKFKRVYFHADIIPKGKYWDLMMKRDGDRITIVPMEPTTRIHGNWVWEARHLSDVLRPVVLSKYGGVYQDRDVLYTSPLPEDVRAYECVKSFDWPRYDEYPEAISPGFIIAKPGARWLKVWLDSMKYYKEGDVTYNSIRLPYRHLELNPTLLHTDRHVQVVCYFGVCHPPWKRTYQQGVLDPSESSWNWENETNALHVTAPKPPKEWETPTAMLAARRKIKDSVFAAVGWNVIVKAGLENVLYELAKP